MDIHIAPLAFGFSCPAAKLAVLSASEIYGRYPIHRARRKFNREAAQRRIRHAVDARDLEPGDHVVHADYGIGIFRGLATRGDPGRRARGPGARIRRGRQALRPARPIPPGLALRRRRQQGPGPLETRRRPLVVQPASAPKKTSSTTPPTCSPSRPNARPSTAMPTRPTPAGNGSSKTPSPTAKPRTSSQSIRQVKEDMESPRPMDRLICGDVGFGKTEVAIRAAFKAVMGGTQAAILVPTTVLAQQHFDTFRQRMSGFPVRVEMLCRLQSPAEQDKIVAGLHDGTVDIVIGTHRLVSKDIVFHDLGLVVIDEEQRFGVKHKERFKELFRLVDVMTLSATPIPAHALHVADRLAGNEHHRNPAAQPPAGPDHHLPVRRTRHPRRHPPRD